MTDDQCPEARAESRENEPILVVRVVRVGDQQRLLVQAVWASVKVTPCFRAFATLLRSSQTNRRSPMDDDIYNVGLFVARTNRRGPLGARPAA